MYDSVHQEFGSQGHVVAVAASAGGVEAISAFLRCLPAHLPSPVLVVQHLPPKRQSSLREVLQQRTSLKVRWAEHGGPLRAGTVYLAPPDWHVSVSTNATLTLSAGSPGDRIRPAADVLFHSVAAVFGRGAIGIVLTGCLDDGAAGAAAIRTAGGRVLVQDPDSCEQPSMPLAAMQAGAVDLCLPVDTLASAVTAMTMVPGASSLFSVGDGYRAALAQKASANPNGYYGRRHDPFPKETQLQVT